MYLISMKRLVLVSDNESRNAVCENHYWLRLRATGTQPEWPAQSGPEPVDRTSIQAAREYPGSKQRCYPHRCDCQNKVRAPHHNGNRFYLDDKLTGNLMGPRTAILSLIFLHTLNHNFSIKMVSVISVIRPGADIIS